MSMINETENRGSWLNDEQIEFVRDRLQFYILMQFR